MTLQLGPCPFGRQNRLYDSIFLESRKTTGTLSIGQIETSMVAGVGLTSGSRSLPPRYGIYGSKHSTKRQGSTIQCSTVSGYNYPNTRCHCAITGSDHISPPPLTPSVSIPATGKNQLMFTNPARHLLSTPGWETIAPRGLNNTISNSIADSLYLPMTHIHRPCP